MKKKKNLIVIKSIIDLVVIVTFLGVLLAIFTLPFTTSLIFPDSEPIWADIIFRYFIPLFFVFLSLSLFFSKFVEGVVLTRKLILLIIILLIIGVALFFKLQSV